MDLERIREFVAFSETLNFTETARRLHMSQSSLSRHIRDMEQELELSLVRRGANGGENTLTAAGQTYLELAGPLLRQHDEAVARCRQIQAVTPPARIHQDVRYVTNVSYQVRTLLESVGAPSGNISFVSTDVPALRALDQDILDFAFYASSVSGREPMLGDAYGCVRLNPQTLCFLVTADNPLTPRGSITLDEVARANILTIESSRYTNWTGATSELFAARGCDLHFEYVPDRPFRGGAFPIGPKNVVLCTKFYASYYMNLDVEDVVQLSIRDFAPTVYPWLVYRRDMTSVVGRQVVVAARRAQGTPACA